MAATAEDGGDFIYIHFIAFRTQADAREFRFQFLKNASHDHRCDGANMINQSFGIIRVCAGAEKVGFLEPEIGDLIVVGQPEVIIDVLQETRAR